MEPISCLVRGTGDIASAVAHALFVAGHRVAMHDGLEPTAARRRMAYSDALFDGEAVLEGVAARRLDDAAALPGILAGRAGIAITAADFEAVLGMLDWRLLVDARMRKREIPERQIHLAPLTVGLGPNFAAGETVAAAVETSWEDLGRVILRGATLPLRGEPRPIAGHARDRYVYAPVAGVFVTGREIGEPVEAGEAVARIGAVTLKAPIAGAIRGLSRDGIAVAPGTKVIEIDPRGPQAVAAGIGERPRRIAAGVLAAVEMLSR